MNKEQFKKLHVGSVVTFGPLEMVVRKVHVTGLWVDGKYEQFVHMVEYANGQNSKISDDTLLVMGVK